MNAANLTATLTTALDFISDDERPEGFATGLALARQAMPEGYAQHWAALTSGRATARDAIEFTRMIISDTVDFVLAETAPQRTMPVIDADEAAVGQTILTVIFAQDRDWSAENSRRLVGLINKLDVISKGAV